MALDENSVSISTIATLYIFVRLSQSQTLTDMLCGASMYVRGMRNWMDHENNLARHIYQVNPLNYSGINMTNYHIMFFRGITPDTIKIVNSYRITIDDIEDILTIPGVDKDTIRRFVENIYKNIQIYNNSQNVSSVTNAAYAIDETKTLNLFNNKTNKDLFAEKLNDYSFYTKLLSFWSGKGYYDNQEKYKIIIQKTYESPLPTSSACFNEITITTYTNFDNFLENLETAVLNTQERFDLAGGSKQKKKQNPKTKK